LLFVQRLPDNAVIEVASEKPVTDAGRRAGVVSDVVIGRLGTDKHNEAGLPSLARGEPGGGDDPSVPVDRPVDGTKPTKRLYELRCHYFNGWATAEEVEHDLLEQWRKTKAGHPPGH